MVVYTAARRGNRGSVVAAAVVVVAVAAVFAAVVAVRLPEMMTYLVKQYKNDPNIHELPSFVRCQYTNITIEL